MTDRDALLRSILEHPQDDLPRLVYVDWLDDAGEADRAEFVRVQCELARIGPKPVCTARNEQHCTNPACERWIEAGGDELHRRERDLLDAHEWDWLHAIHPELQRGSHDASTGRTWWLRKPVWSRGFLKSVEVDWETFREIHAGLFWGPRQTVECDGDCSRWHGLPPGAVMSPKNLDKLFKCPDCKGTGRIQRPFVPTAQPLETVRLTTRPNLIEPGETTTARLSEETASFTTPDGYRFDRVKCECDVPFSCPRCNDRPLNRWMCNSWPGLTFIMPESERIGRYLEDAMTEIAAAH